MQEKYWNYMVQVKAWIFYLDTYAENSYRCERRINMINAFSSSGSIAAWAIWSEISFVWAFIIASSQVITAIQVFLPFNRRLKLLIPFMEHLKVLYNKIEYNWYRVASGDLSENEINEILYKYKNEYTNFENKYLKEELLIEREDYLKDADQKTMSYFINNF